MFYSGAEAYTGHGSIVDRRDGVLWGLVVGAERGTGGTAGSGAEWSWRLVLVRLGCGAVYWWGLMRIDLYGVKAAMLCERLANNKKSSTRSNSFSRIFIFPAPPQDFEIPNFFSGPQ